MAKRGPASRSRTRDAARTREKLWRAARDLVATAGYNGATGAAIAERAGVSEPTVFYHFGSVDALLVAALAASSAERMTAYRDAVGTLEDPSDILAALLELQEEDRTTGHTGLLVGLMSAVRDEGITQADLTANVGPWLDFVEEQLNRVLGSWPLAEAMPHRDAAYIIVTFFAGLHLMRGVEGHAERLESVLRSVGNFAKFFGIDITQEAM